MCAALVACSDFVEHDNTHSFICDYFLVLFIHFLQQHMKQTVWSFHEDLWSIVLSHPPFIQHEHAVGPWQDQCVHECGGV